VTADAGPADVSHLVLHHRLGQRRQWRAGKQSGPGVSNRFQVLAILAGHPLLDHLGGALAYHGSGLDVEDLNATVTGLVALKNGPTVNREGPTTLSLIAVLLVVSAVVPFIVVFFENSVRR